MVSALRLSHRDVEELLAERGIEVDHVTLYRRVQHFTLLAVEAAGPCRHTTGVRWFVDETYVKVAGAWRHVYRAVDEHGQVIDKLVSARRDIAAARRFFVRMLAVQEDPEEVTTDRAPTLAAVIAELLPAAVHVTEQHPNNRMECDHGRLKARLQPMHGLKTFRSARTSEGMPSSRTCGAATMNSGSKPGTGVFASQPPSANSPEQSDPPGWTSSSPGRHDCQRNRGLCHVGTGVASRPISVAAGIAAPTWSTSGRPSGLPVRWSRRT